MSWQTSEDSRGDRIEESAGCSPGAAGGPGGGRGEDDPPAPPAGASGLERGRLFGAVNKFLTSSPLVNKVKFFMVSWYRFNRSPSGVTWRLPRSRSGWRNLKYVRERKNSNNRKLDARQTSCVDFFTLLKTEGEFRSNLKFNAILTGASLLLHHYCGTNWANGWKKLDFFPPDYSSLFIAFFLFPRTKKRLLFHLYKQGGECVNGTVFGSLAIFKPFEMKKEEEILAGNRVKVFDRIKFLNTLQ